MGKVFGAFKAGMEAKRVGQMVNAMARKLLADTLNSPDWIAFAPGIREDGTPGHNGFSSRDPRIGDPSYDGVILPGLRRPDMLFGEYPAMSEQKNWIIAELKLSTKTLVDDYTTGDVDGDAQLSAIANYTKRYTLSGRIACFITLFQGGKGGGNYRKNILTFAEEAIKKHEIVAVVITLTGKDQGSF